MGGNIRLARDGNCVSCVLWQPRFVLCSVKDSKNFKVMRISEDEKRCLLGFEKPVMSLGRALKYQTLWVVVVCQVTACN